MSLEDELKQKDEQYMRIAIAQAKIAEENGDVPIGCFLATCKTMKDNHKKTVKFQKIEKFLDLCI